MEKKFNTVLEVPKAWRSLLRIESFDDLTGFLEMSAPPEAVASGGRTRADWPRPLRDDLREVTFSEDGYNVSLALHSGNEHYYTIASVVMPNGDRYAHSDAGYEIRAMETLEIRGMGVFSWAQRLV